MSALDAFYAAWTNARSRFGVGTPQDGTRFDASAKLRQLGNDVGRSTPGSVWSGRAATAYEATSASHRAFLDRIADLDQRLSKSVDHSVRIVNVGRQNLDALSKWVANIAGSVPPGRDREMVFTQIASSGLTRLSDIVRGVHGDLSDVGRDIRGISNEYDALTFKETPAPSVEDEPVKDVIGNETDMASGDINQIDRANRELLQKMLKEYRQLPDGRVRADRLADIAAITDALKLPDSYLVHLKKPDDPSQMIPAATSVGDPFTADHVSVTVPGVSGSTRETIAGMTTEAAELRNEARDIAERLNTSQDIAAVAWVGYQPPPNLGDTSALSDDLAQSGAPKLTSLLHDLDAASKNPGQTTALFGHSYGSLTSGIALQEGSSQYVDNAVLYGSPGFQAASPAELGMNDDNFFVMSARDDPINTIGTLAPFHGWGSDPNDIVNDDGQLRFRFQHLETDTGATPIAGYESKTGASGHSDYGRNAGERMTGYNLAAILLNRSDIAVKESPLSW